MSEKAEISLFIPCMIDQVYPEMGMAMVRVLERLGYSLRFNGNQVCCGQPAFNAGHLAESQNVAAHFCSCFEPSETIVCPSGSCTAMVRNHYGAVFKGHPLETVAERLSKNVCEFSEFLMQQGRAKDISGELKAKAVYHCSCHALRELGIPRDGVRELLAGISGLELVEPDGPHKCCGFGGLFFLKYPVISDSMVEERLAQLAATGADIVISNDPGCIMMLRRGLETIAPQMKIFHLAEVLDLAFS